MWMHVKPNGTVEEHEGTPSLDELQEACGGYVEAHTLTREGEQATAWMAEEAPDMDANPQADWLARMFATPPRNIAGTIRGALVVTGIADSDGKVTELSETWRLFLKDMPSVRTSEAV